jgi:hypothetical protein
MAKDDDNLDERVIVGSTIVKIEDDKEESKDKTRPEDNVGAATRSDRDDRDEDDDHDNLDDGEGGDQDAGAGDDENVDDRRNRRREERKNRRRARRDGQRRAQQELAELREAMGVMGEEIRQLRGMTSNTHVSQIDARLTTAERQLADAEEAHALAIKKGDGESAVEALRLRDSATRAVYALKSAKAQIEGASRRRERDDGQDDRGPRRQQQAPQISERAITMAQGWMASVPWYKAQGSDKDSELVREIDAEVLKDGFDPDTPAYYAELTNRVREELPHRYSASKPGARGNPPRRSGPPIGGSDRRAIGANEVVLDENRRRALEDANIDPQSEKGRRILRTWKNEDNKQAAR